jgi:hypothetical protein
MKKIILATFLFAKIATAQGALPWGQAVSVPLLATQPGVAMFYVSSYNWVGTHTDYDMARQAADAYLAAHPQTSTYVVLSPLVTQTCDAVPLPTVPTGSGTFSTVSIIGYGSNVSTLVRRVGCTPRVATLSHPDSPGGLVSNALYQGFTVSANHIDSAACGFYAMSSSTFFDLACGNAAPGADHEIEFGNSDPNNIGRVYGASIYNLKSFDIVGVGKGANLAPVWSGGTLSGVTVVNGGTKKYTQQYISATVVGPDLSTCTSVPTLVPIVSSVVTSNFSNLPPITSGYVTGAMITNPGSCSSTAKLYILIQDGVNARYGMKFTNMASSHVWNLEPTGASTYGEAWLSASANNTIIGEHPYTNQTIQIAEYANSNKHTNAFFDSPGEFGAAIYSQYGSFINSIFSWDSASYTGSAGYYLGAAPGSYQNWAIKNSQCSNSSANFITITTTQGALPSTDPPPSGVTFNDLERCDGTHAVDWPTQVGPQ